MTFALSNSFLVLAFIAFVNAQHISDKPCPERPIQQNLDMNKYTSSVWYDILVYEAPFLKGCDCGQSSYTLNDDNSIEFKKCCLRKPNTSVTCSVGHAVLSEPDHIPLEGKFNFAYSEIPKNVSNYWILSTDYDNYAIAYHCRNIDDNKSSELAFLLSRQPQLHPAVQVAVETTIGTYFDRSKMHQVEQSAQHCEPRGEPKE